MIKILDSIFQVLKDLLPDRRDPILTWILKLVLIVLIVITGFTLVRDTPLGVSWGINSPPAKQLLSNKEYRDINTVLYTYLIRIKEEVPDARGIYFVVAFDKNGNINFADENFDRVGVFTWYSISTTYISFNTFEEVFVRETRDELIQVSKTKECLTGKINKLGIERYKQAIPSFIADRYALCPVPQVNKNRAPYGTIIVYWVHDDKRPQVEAQVLKALKLATENVSYYLGQRKDLELNK